ncbi:UNVERIFIED_CONTAM: hypothetical protein Sangu_1935200 [Sesamum angustifolium]|uniref:Uncharacterized protein n=1 Tax=Sesamum angustifolium TaxID=2727405 RepID=A0AAW2LVN6_9LAMI
MHLHSTVFTSGHGRNTANRAAGRQALDEEWELHLRHHEFPAVGSIRRNPPAAHPPDLGGGVGEVPVMTMVV